MKRTVINDIIKQDGSKITLVYESQEYSLVEIVKFRKWFNADVKPIAKGIISAEFYIGTDFHRFLFIAEK